MLKKASSFVLASLGTSTYRKKYASVPRSLRPRWTAFLTILSERTPSTNDAGIVMRSALLITGLLIVTALVWPGRVSAEPSVPADPAPALSANDLVLEEEVLVRIRDRKFMPSTVLVHAGRKTKLVFRNQDAELHVFVPGTLFNGISLSVEGNGAPEFGEQGFRKVIIPGDGMAELRFTLERPGRYPFICDMPGHEMRGTLVVE
jgi:plastocyanin